MSIIKNNFFEKRGLKETSKDSLPQKISRHNYTTKKEKQDEFEKVKQKYYGKFFLNQESDYPDETKEVVAELQGNIEDFKDSLKSQLKNLQKKNERGNVEEIADEINLHKKNYKNHIEERNNQNLKEITILVEKLNEFKDDIHKEIGINSIKNEQNIGKLNEELSDFKVYCNEKIDVLERKQKSDLESVILFLDRSSRTKKVIFNESINSIQEYPKYKKPKKKEIKDIIGDNKKNSRKDSLLKYDIQNFLNKKQNLNKNLNEELIDNKNKIHKNNYYDSKMKKINKFRSFVYAIMAYNIIQRPVKNTLYRFRKFMSNYEKLDNLLNLWVFDSIKNTFMSVIKFSNLKLEVLDTSMQTNYTETEIRNKFVKVQVQINNFRSVLMD